MRTPYSLYLKNNYIFSVLISNCELLVIKMRFSFLIKRIKFLVFLNIYNGVCFKSDVEKAEGKHMFVEEHSDFVSFVPLLLLSMPLENIFTFIKNEKFCSLGISPSWVWDFSS